MKKIFSPGFLPKFLTLFLLLIELLAIIGGVVFLTTEFMNRNLFIWAVVIIFIINLFVSVYIVNSSSPDVYKISWLFLVNIIPLIGAIGYALLANKQTSKQRHKKFLRWKKHLQKMPTDPEIIENMDKSCPEFTPVSSYISFGSGLGAYQRSHVTYFKSGEDGFQTMLEELRKAKHYIFIEYFIIETPSTFWDSILEILKEKAKEGLDVRVIYDDMGCLGTLPFRYNKELEKMGIKCAIYEPFRPFLDVRLNNRDHRKIMDIDGHTCFSGGINIADEYLNLKPRFGYWKDNTIMIKGEAVFSYTMMFLANWMAINRLEGGVRRRFYRPERYIEEAGGFPENDGFVQPYCDLPYDQEAVGETTYMQMLNQARDYVYIVTPYFIITKEMQNCIANCAHRGVKVTILTPHIPDKKAVFHLTRSFYGDLIKAGVRFFEYTPGFVHEKVFLVDGRMATVGTINLDYRSLYLHLECGTLLMDCQCIDVIKEDFEQSLQVSEEITLERWEKWHRRHRSYWAILRLVAPFL